MNTQAIGIFDSGIGGLTVASAIHKLLPNEQLIYFGDTAHLPYGDKSPELILEYSKAITLFLKEQNCKMIVIACNTASAHAYTALTELYPELPIINVVDPVVNYVGQNCYFQNIGIIATKGTIQSKVYPHKLKKINPSLHIQSLATPLLAPMIEEGFFNDKISQTVINNYLSDKKLKDVTVMVLACTHYPLIKKQVQKFYHYPVHIIDTAEIVAQEVKNYLQTKQLLNPNTEKLVHHFYVSDFTASFQKSTHYFFGNKVKLEKKVL
jgi:glutamate racemase